MARRYAKIESTIWTGETGRAIRDRGGDAQRLAFYLMTCPTANMIGLYYLPVPTICHEVGLDAEEARKALRSLSEVGFADYDFASEQVFVREFAAYQIGPQLKPTDNVVKSTITTWQEMRKSPFFMDFYRRYAQAYHLPEPVDGPTPSEAPSEPLRSQEQEQEQEQDHEQEHNQEQVDHKCANDQRNNALEAREVDRDKAAPRVRRKSVRASDVEFPIGMDTPENRIALERWLAHKRFRRKPYKDADQVRLLLVQFVKNNGAEVFVEAVSHSIAQNYDGCFPPNKRKSPERVGDGQRHNPEGVLSWRK